MLLKLIFLSFLIILSQALSDPCLDYVPGTNHCQNCSDGYQFALVNETTTFCAQVYDDEQHCIINDPYYYNDLSYNSTYKFLTTFTVDYQYCFNCTSYFQLPDGQNLCYGGCPQYFTPYYKYKTIDSQSLGCQVCALQDYQMQTILNYDFISLYVKTCTANIEQTACDMTEFYDSESNRCIACIDKYPRCGACNENECLITLYQYYNASGLYNYTSREFDINQLIFWFCNYGAAFTNVGNSCDPSNVENCIGALIANDGSESCYLCAPGYNSVGAGCELKDSSQTNFTYFVFSGAQYNTTADVSYYFENEGTSIKEPFYFIGSALQTIFSYASESLLVNATIYLSQGDHFFFYCDEYSGNIFNAKNIIQYCEEFYSYLHQYPVTNDNIYLYFKPLECSLATELGYQDDPLFMAMCVNLTTMSRPTIYVNQAYSYFQIYGFARFENIIFSGVNQLVQSVISTNDLSTLPILLCNTKTEPKVGDQALSLQAVNNSNFSINYKCRNVNYTGSTIPNTSASSFTCNRNENDYFYQEEESTLNSPGEPTYYYYFYQAEYYVEVPISPRRRNTLFNIYAFPDFMSVFSSPPQLEIENCTFQYFLQNYESLINVETNDFQFLTLGDQMPYNDDMIYNYSFISYGGGERGAKISIKNSEFKHSSFGKGLIVYRKQPYIDELDTLGFGNFTYYLMAHPYVQDNGSYIILENSSFTNLNTGFQNISALAIYGGNEVWRTMSINNTNVKYQGFIHKGTVINIEDFGGYVKIRNCTFSYNMHFIPQIMQTNYSSSSSSRNIANFMDNSNTDEYKMAVCDQNTKEDLYFFSSGVNEDDDLDTYYDLFERLSMIYISRNRDKVIITNNTFLSNIGTFGGAISINSQNWDAGKTPYIVIQDNTFKQNMAYFSGNAIYIRNSKNQDDQNTICGGVNIINNIFEHNIGMKVHNGGAVSVSCYYVTSHLQQDYYSTSGQSIQNISNQQLSQTTKITDPVNSSLTYQIHPYSVNIQDCLFKENYAGSKGTAIYLRMINNIRIYNCTFTNNGPVLSYFEELYSPYYQYLSQRTMTYYDENGLCTNEFEFLSECQYEGSIIDWPHIQGAVYVEHCQEETCFTSSVGMNLLIENSVFSNNQAGYVMDSNFPQNLSSQISIKGGFNNTISNCSFNNANGSYSNLTTKTLHDYFPTEYFISQHASLIYLEVDPDVDQDAIFATTIVKCSFVNNQHIQPLGLTSSQQYYGSLISASSPNSLAKSLHTTTLNIINCTFKDNSFIGLETQLIYLLNVLTTLKSTIFQNNGLLIQANASLSYNYYKDSSFVKTNSTYFSFDSYYFYYYQDYGLMYIEGYQIFLNGSSHQIFNNQFHYTFSKQSSVVFVNVGNQFIYLRGNIYTNNFVESGAIINGFGQITTYLRADSTIQMSKSIMNSTILIVNDTFYNQISSTGILSFQFSNSLLILNLAITNCSFKNNFQSQAYGLISLTQVGKVLITDCQFMVNISKSSSETFFKQKFIQTNYPLSQFINLSLIYQNTYIDYFSGLRVFIFNGIENTNQNIYFGNQVLTINSQYFKHIEITDCQFDNFYSLLSGVLITITDASYLCFTNAAATTYSINNCSVGDQGIFFISNSTVTVQNIRVTNSVSSASTSVFYLTLYSNLQIYNSTFLNNTAFNYGVIYITGSSIFYCSYCTFIQNSVSLESSVIYADNNPSGGITITNSVFTNNTSSSNLFNLITTPTSITNSVFLDNESQFVCNGITGTNSIISLVNVTVNYTTNDFINHNSNQVDACFFNLNFLTTLNISMSVIQNCRGGTAGVMYATGYSNIYIDNNSVFKDNLSSEDASGSILYFLTTQVVSIMNSQFINNGIIDIYVQRATASIVNTTFSIGNQQFIYGYASAINITNSTFSNGTNFNILGKALYCYCYQLIIQNSFFSNLGAVKGGAVYLTSSSESSTTLIQSNTFNSNEAQFGGAIYINDAVQLSLLNNSFKWNTAQYIYPPTQTSNQLIEKGLGGAIYFGCTNLALNLNNKCSIFMGQSNTFYSNSAQNDGGALIWVANELQSDQSDVFISNQATYGSNEASYPRNIIIYFVSNNDYYDTVNNTLNSSVIQLNTSMNYFPKIVSGISFSFLVYILDQNGDVYNTDSSSTATLKYSDTEQSVLINGNEVKASSGVYNFSDTIVITQPGTNISLQLVIADVTTYDNVIPFVESPTNIFINLRSCVSGEQMLNLACSQCPSGYYLYEAPTNDTSCKQCEVNSICAGSNIVYPSAGYWRENNTSDDWIECTRTKSCLEGDADHLTSNCAEGYLGIVCGDCQDGYSRQSDFECSLCPEQKSNIIKLSLVGLAIVIIVILLVVSTFSSATKNKSPYSVYFKIMTSHFQIVNAISNINFEWPTNISSLYTSFVTVSSVNEQIFSIDCFLKVETSGLSLGIYFQKLLLYGLLPFILALVDLLFWIVYCIIKRKFSSIVNSFISTLVILLFLVHPTITQEMFQAFNCVEIAGLYYLRADLDYQCYQGQHLRALVIIVIPSIFIWSFGIPLFALILLMKNKNTILKESTQTQFSELELHQIRNVKVKYGFIFNGYRPQQYYYEIIIQYRKVALIMVTVILSIVSPEIQALLSFLVLIISMLYQHQKKPFQTKVLNRMETFSLLVSTTTMYSGMYFITGQHYSYGQNQVLEWVFMVLLVVPNVLYFIYWFYYTILEVFKQAHKMGPRYFCLLTLGLWNYKAFQKRFMTDQVQESVLPRPPKPINDNVNLDLDLQESEESKFVDDSPKKDKPMMNQSTMKQNKKTLIDNSEKGLFEGEKSFNYSKKHAVGGRKSQKQDKQKDKSQRNLILEEAFDSNAKKMEKMMSVKFETPKFDINEMIDKQFKKTKTKETKTFQDMKIKESIPTKQELQNPNLKKDQYGILEFGIEIKDNEFLTKTTKVNKKKLKSERNKQVYD